MNCISEINFIKDSGDQRHDLSPQEKLIENSSVTDHLKED